MAWQTLGPVGLQHGIHTQLDPETSLGYVKTPEKGGEGVEGLWRHQDLKNCPLFLYVAHKSSKIWNDGGGCIHKLNKLFPSCISNHNTVLQTTLINSISDLIT